MICLKDTLKLFGITIICCCAAFVCTLFLYYKADLTAIRETVVLPEASVMYEAQVAMSRAVSMLSGGCLAVTSLIMLVFYIKNYIDTHGKELGILKAIGYSNAKIALNFWVFGLSVLLGCVFGHVAAFLYLPKFYAAQDWQTLFPALTLQFHPVLSLCLTVVPAVCFAALSVVYAFFKLTAPVLDLLKERKRVKVKARKNEEAGDFLSELKRDTLRSKKVLAFFIVFSSFCFAAMTQMSVSMYDYASKAMSAITLMIGLILAVITLTLSLSSVVKDNAKTVAMMHIFGYAHSDVKRAVINVYRPFSYFGFALGTAYQYVLLKIMFTVVFADVMAIEYKFEWKAFGTALVLFILFYEMEMWLYARKVNKVNIKFIMAD